MSYLKVLQLFLFPSLQLAKQCFKCYVRGLDLPQSIDINLAKNGIYEYNLLTNRWDRLYRAYLL